MSALNLRASLQTYGKRIFILLIFVGLFWTVYIASSNREPDPIVREFFECVSAVCRDLPGAGDVCVLQKPQVTKISIIDIDGAKTVRFTLTNDRCVNGSNN